jgi:hypothetical protein
MSKPKNCKYCQSEIDGKAKICPICNKKQGGKLKFVIIGIVAIFILSALFGGGDEETEVPVNTDQSQKIAKEEPKEQTEEPTEEVKEEIKEEAKEVDPPASTETSSLTMGQENALSKAESYLDYSSFSYKGLIEQLEFDEFSTEDATYAADNCGADWNEQAALKAQQYLDYSSFSRNELIEQLEFDGFTKDQAEYGVKAVGY